MGQNTDHQRVASGAGAVLLGRLGALIEAVSVIAFAWLYGAETFGLFAFLWAAIKVIAAFTDGAMTTALQRYIPQATAAEADKIAGFALKASFLFAFSISLIIVYFAKDLAAVVNANNQDSEQLVSIMRFYAFTLPFWTLVEVSTASIRAKRTFGPEIKVRIFYEQILRLILGVSLAVAGMVSHGLFIAHFLSVFVAALFGLKLVKQHYSISEVIRSPIFKKSNYEVLIYGMNLMPANLTKRMFSEVPVILLNQFLPGASGAAAAGYFAVARKIASILQVIRLTFEYVMAPLASEKRALGDQEALSSMFQYATRLSITFALPICALLITGHYDVLATMPKEFMIASTAIIILSLGRALEAMSGPSTSIIEMIGHRSLSTVNSAVGLTVMCVLSYLFIPKYGVIGAAIAATSGLNTTAWLAMLECMITYSVKPYSASLLRPVAVSILSLLPFLICIHYKSYLDPPFMIISAFTSLFLSMALIMRYGLSEVDAKSLGKWAQVFRR
ncbi:oligosaccharide flippase family protein [Temperatibacter marinus]|uniref:Oligosaccharide flippase family protein n=1 Tax=Temperatibacter marinus TaxID=1456591 RepID=A0AA52EG41_9PROT|nr:oligosaccharide flippase family protein [Temperatibacter marinus]WND01902.1 oligosaccharide flippase family protein [Temperatibacter marinus]